MEKNFEVIEDLFSYSWIKDKNINLPYSFVKEKKILPLEKDNQEVLIATTQSLNIELLKELRLFFRSNIRMVYCTPYALEKAIAHCYEQYRSEKDKQEKISTKQTSINDVEDYDLLEQVSENPAIRFLNSLIIQAIQMNASDIHFESYEEEMKIRFRIDGILQEAQSPFSDQRSQLITRIKVMAKLDIAEQRLPQDGRVKLKLGDREVDFRISTIPTVFGERIVLRILDRKNVLLGLDKIGMKVSILEKFQNLIQYPEGIILVTGPTGSGKTTTLYSAMCAMDKTQKNIMTIEDPVEYKIQNIAQMNVNPKINLNFSTGLRHILRQDPDVILIGEIRDKETADIALQASLTGHLVFATLHTNDAPSAIIRLIEMGIEKYLLSSSILGILAQRLVRKICKYCKVSYIPSVQELMQLQVRFEKKSNFYKGTGCEKCFYTGYKGRHAIYELLIIDSKLKQQILKEEINAESLKAFAEYEKLLHSGIALILEGITTTSEVVRVTKDS